VVTVLRSAASVVRGLSALAAAKVAHRDVSDGNILYDTNTRPPVMRLIDFGVSKPFAHVYQTPSGSEQVQFNYPPEFAFTSTGSIGPVVKADNGLKTWYQWEDDITNESGPNVFTIPARTRARCTRLALQLQQAQDPRDTSWQAAAVGKFDTYGLGVSLHVFLLGAARTVPALQAASRDPAPPWVADVCRILMGMTHPNFEERLGPEEAWTAWQRLRW
jgi:serine/threonine protein kinase